MSNMTTGSEFYEPDEPLADVLSAFNAAAKGVTQPHLPPGAAFVTTPRTFGVGATRPMAPTFPGVRVVNV